MTLTARRRRSTGAVVVVSAVLALVGCSGGDEAAPTPSATSTTPSETESTFEIRPVVGERIFALFDVSSSEILGRGGRQGVDEARANAAMTRAADWLDAHLDSLQTGGGGELAAVLPPDHGQDDELAAVSTDLTSPDAPVDEARYAISAYGDGAPEWVTAQVEVVHPDGATTVTTMVFDLVEEDALRLVLGGPDMGAEAAEPEPEPEATADDASEESDG